MKNIRPEKLYVQVFNEIQHYMVKHQLKANDLLPTEQQMCQMLGVSRNVVREALKAMELMGIVKSVSGVGSVVQEFKTDYFFKYMFCFFLSQDDRRIWEVLSIRRMMELSYLEQAFHSLSPRQLDKMQMAYYMMEDNVEDVYAYHNADQQFHMSIYEQLDNQVLLSILGSVWEVDANFYMEEKKTNVQHSLAKHKKILEAAQTGDYAAFCDAVHQHFQSGKYSEDKQFFEQQNTQ